MAPTNAAELFGSMTNEIFFRTGSFFLYSNVMFLNSIFPRGFFGSIGFSVSFMDDFSSRRRNILSD